MTYKFKIKNSQDSMKHQHIFFTSGYSWTPQRTAHNYQHLDGKFLYITRNGDKHIFYSDTGKGDTSEDIPCKLLHPRQKKFLEKTKYKLILEKEKIVDEILKNGFYEEYHAGWLNKLISFNMLMV